MILSLLYLAVVFYALGRFLPDSWPRFVLECLAIICAALALGALIRMW